MPSDRVALDVPLPLVLFVAAAGRSPPRDRHPDGTRALTCSSRRCPRWRGSGTAGHPPAAPGLRDLPGHRLPVQGRGRRSPRRRAPTLREALERAVDQGLPYLILDGTLVSSDRCADKKTSRKGKEIDTRYSGKAHEPAGNVQALAAPGGVPLSASDVLPGSTHDLTAARELVLPEARPYLKDLPILADSGYEGAGAGVHVPVKKPRRGELDIDTKTRNALLRSLRYQGERGFALMSQRWRALSTSRSARPRSATSSNRTRPHAVRTQDHQLKVAENLNGTFQERHSTSMVLDRHCRQRRSAYSYAIIFQPGKILPKKLIKRPSRSGFINLRPSL